MKKIFKVAMLCVAICTTALFTQCEKADEPTVYQTAANTGSDSLVSFNEVLAGLKNDEIRQTLLDLQAKAKQKGGDTGFGDLGYFEKFEYTKLTNYCLNVSSYTDSSPYYLQFIIEIDKQTGEEKSGFLKFVPQTKSLQPTLNVNTFTGQLQALNNSQQLQGGVLFTSGRITGNMLGTTTCTTTVVMISHPCTNDGLHEFGQSCSPGYINVAYLSFQFFTDCWTTFPTNGTGGGSGGGGGGGGRQAIDIFYENLDNDQKWFLDNNTNAKNIIEQYVKKTGITTCAERLVDIGRRNMPLLQLLLNRLTQSNYSQEDTRYVSWAADYLTANPNVTLSQFRNWFTSKSEGTDGTFDAAYWDNPNLTFPQQILPSFDDFYLAYPSHYDSEYDTPAKMYNSVGGVPLSIYNSSQNGNTCALRVSKALNYSGVSIPNLPNKTFKGADNKYYFLSAANLLAWMKKTFGTPTGNNHLTGSQGGANGENFVSLLQGKKGIYIMTPYITGCSGGFCASGHADMIEDNECDGGCYFAATGGVKEIFIWELN